MSTGLGRAQIAIRKMLAEQGQLTVSDIRAAFPGVDPKSCRRAMRGLAERGLCSLMEGPMLSIHSIVQAKEGSRPEGPTPLPRQVPRSVPTPLPRQVPASLPRQVPRPTPSPIPRPAPLVAPAPSGSTAPPIGKEPPLGLPRPLSLADQIAASLTKDPRVAPMRAIVQRASLDPPPHSGLRKGRPEAQSGPVVMIVAQDHLTAPPEETLRFARSKQLAAAERAANERQAKLMASLHRLLCPPEPPNPPKQSRHKKAPTDADTFTDEDGVVWNTGPLPGGVEDHIPPQWAPYRRGWRWK